MASHVYNCFFLNIREIGNKKGDLTNFLKSNKIQIMVLVETMLQGHQIFNIPGYNVVRQDRQRRGGGVAILIHKDTAFKKVYSINMNDDFQALLIKIGNISLAAIYNPPHNDLEPEMLEEINSRLAEDFIVVGDFNAHHHFWGSSRRSHSSNVLYQFALSTNWILMNDLNRTKLGNRNQEDSILDLFFVAPTLAHKFNFKPFSENLNSDHLVVGLSVLDGSEYTSSLPNIPDFRKYISARADWISFRDQIDDGHTGSRLGGFDGDNSDRCQR